MQRLSPAVPVFALVTLIAVPSPAQSSLPYVRHKTPRVGRQSPMPVRPRSATPTPEQRLAIATVKWPATWPAPKVPPGTVLTVPQRPDWMPETGEYWGPFTDEAGSWGFLVGPNPASSSPRPTVVPMRMTRQPAVTAPLTPPPPPAAPVLPKAGPVSPEGRMIVSYPDGNQVTWQFPMVEYRVRLLGTGSDGTLQLADGYGRRATMALAANARITLNGRAADRGRLKAGAQGVVRALRIAPTQLTVVELTQ